ncbi:hypothetical protein CARUB_v10025027mg [Capsella rubella]|uniref:Uncharacterized protein n=1 Tax=Capsella rubella TaxID=81985 RepID=R0HTQ6_9BRAS|nr:uncharacterized protein LOC17889341 [Capsella rubella]EOA28795.1 hypothetical protein CARUB_v10025027mg [Capsella rubella]
MDDHDPDQGINEISTVVVIDNDNKSRKQNLEAEKRLKKVEQDYLHTSQKYTEIRSQSWGIYDEKRRAVNSSRLAADYIDRCNNLVEQLQKALDKLPKGETAEETIDHSQQFSLLHQKAQFQELDYEGKREFREFSRELNCIRKKMPRSDSRKAGRDLLKDVCNPTSQDSLKNSLELELKVLKKLTRKLQKDWEEELQIKQYAKNIYKDFKQKVKHLEKKKEHLSGQWDKEKNIMLETKKTHDTKTHDRKTHDRKIGTYPEAYYIMMVNDNVP